jgi:hypothetical protein
VTTDVLCGSTATVGSFCDRLPVLHAAIVASLEPS